jgi:hypothetical protein
MSKSVTIELSDEHHAWLQRVAERANLQSGEVLRLQLVAQAHITDLNKGATAALPGLDDDASQYESTLADDDASVMDMLSNARDRLNEWEERRDSMKGKNSRLEALRRRLNEIGADAGDLNLGPQVESSSPTLIQQAMSRIESIQAESLDRDEDDEDRPTSMFEMADKDRSKNVKK